MRQLLKFSSKCKDHFFSSGMIIVGHCTNLKRLKASWRHLIVLWWLQLKRNTTMEVRDTRNGSKLWPQEPSPERSIHWTNVVWVPSGLVRGRLITSCFLLSDASLETRTTLFYASHILEFREMITIDSQNVTSVLHSTITQEPLFRGVLRSRPVRFTYQFPTLLKWIVRKFKDHPLIAQGLRKGFL